MYNLFLTDFLMHIFLATPPCAFGVTQADGSCGSYVSDCGCNCTVSGNRCCMHGYYGMGMAIACK